MSVAVISSTGKILMPTSEYRARKLLKSGKAVKHSYSGFRQKAHGFNRGMNAFFCKKFCGRYS